MTKVNPILKWWVGEKLPIPDIFSGYEKKATDPLDYLKRLVSMWVIHPIKRRVARIYLKLLQTFTGIKVIAITGSSGKTTTTEMLASILKQDGKTIWSKQSIDSVYNLPNTILRATPSTKYLILEMSVEYPGEMDFYLWLAKVDVGVITNIFPTHLEYFGGIEGVFKEKSKLVGSLRPEGVSILNYDDKLLRKLKGKLKSKIVWFGQGSEVASSLEKTTNDYKTLFIIVFDHDQSKNIEITLPVMGIQFVQNALAAVAVSKTLKIPSFQIKKGLEEFNLPSHRMRIFKHGSGAIILDDSYNNNPMAAIETVNTFKEFAVGKDKVIVFGDMLELGSLEEKYHKQLGEYLGRINLSKLICVGNASRFTAISAAKIMGEENVIFVTDINEAYYQLKPYLKDGIVILIKGSRSINLDKLVEKL